MGSCFSFCCVPHAVHLPFQKKPSPSCHQYLSTTCLKCGCFTSAHISSVTARKFASLLLLVHMWCPNGSHSCSLPGPAAGRRIFFPDSSSCRDHDIFQPFHRVSCKMLSYSCLSYWQLKPSRGWQPYILPQLPSRIRCRSYFSSS